MPWLRIPNTELDDFYRDNGYFPALQPDEEEYVKAVHGHEKRQPVAVTLGTCYDDWCLSRIAKVLGKDNDYDYFFKRSLNYRNIYNTETGFFHPKDKHGAFIAPFDYRYAGGQGARNYYGENNGWIYRWDVPHNVDDLIRLMGSRQNFTRNLDQMFREPLGKINIHSTHNYPITQVTSDNILWPMSHPYTFLTYTIMRVLLGKLKKGYAGCWSNGSGTT